MSFVSCSFAFVSLVNPRGEMLCYMARKGKVLPYSRHRVDVGLPHLEAIQLCTESRRVWTSARVCSELITREHNNIQNIQNPK